MANLRAIHSVGSSLVAYLAKTFPSDLQNSPQSCEFKLFSSAEMTRDDHQKIVSLFLYRITLNEHLRNTGGPSDPSGPAPLALNLHYLLTIWAPDALTEHVVFSWALRQLHLHETLTVSDLSPDGGWGPGDFVQVIPAELSSEDMSRIWMSLGPKYRLSVSYIARVVRIDPDATPDARPVVARRIALSERGSTP
jgi:hypothetical protein